MSELSVKRQKLEAAPEPSLIERCSRYCKEVEQVPIHDGQIAGYLPTFRCSLARKGLVVDKTLGSGSYSKVKRAYNIRQKDHYPVAVKIIDKQNAAKEYQTKFLPRELKSWPRLKHSNLIQLYEVFDDQRYIFMVMEYAGHGDALHYVQKNGALENTLAHSWMSQLAEAILYLHKQNVAHRDLKLENILVDTHGRIKLADFGFVKEETHLQLSHTFCGSRSYAAPEILEGRPYPPEKADVWAFGVIIYILVTGRMPFDETHGTQQLLADHRRCNFDWSRYAKVHPACRDVILAAFTYHFKSRPCMDFLTNMPWFLRPNAGPSEHGLHITGTSSTRRIVTPVTVRPAPVKRTFSDQSGHRPMSM